MHNRRIYFVILFLFMLTLSSCTSKEKVEVTFDSNAGTEVKSVQVSVGRKVSRPNDPIRYGYELAGWYLDDKEWDFSKDKVQSKMTLTACWTNVTLELQKNGEYAVTGLIDEESYNVFIPDTFNGKKVTSIVDNAFSKYKNIRIVQLSSNLVSIGNSAFENCSLDKIELPSTLEKIGDFAFMGCEFKTLEIPNGVVEIGIGAFSYCSELREFKVNNNSNYKAVDGSLYSQDGTILIKQKRVDFGAGIIIPDHVKKIDSYAFSGSTNSAYIEFSEGLIEIADYAFVGVSLSRDIFLPNSLEIIGKYAFHNASMYDMYIGENVTTIGNNAFASTSVGITIDEKNKHFIKFENTLYSADFKRILKYGRNGDATTFILPDTVEVIDDYAFYKDHYLTNIQLPKTLKNIGNYAFYRKSSLINISFPNNLKIIGDYAFYGCDNLESIVIPDSVNYLGENCFSACYAAKTIDIGDGITEIQTGTFAGCTSVENIIFGSNIETIGDSTFLELNTKTLVLPEGLVSIGKNSFLNCKVEELVLPSTLTTIGESSFYYTNIKKLVLPDNILTIHQNAFAKCFNLEEVHIGKGLINLDPVAFEQNTNLVQFVVSGDNPNFKSIDGNLYSKDEKTLIKYAIGKPDISFNVLQSVEIIADYSVSYAVKLEKIIIPNSVTSIKEYSFFQCINVNELQLSNNLISIGKYAFGNLTEITDLKLPESLESLEEGAFYYCSNVKTVFLGKNLSNFDPLAFCSCRGLEEIKISNENQYYKSVDNNIYSKDGKVFITYLINKTETEFSIPEGVVTIGKNAFYDSISLKKIVIPKSVTKIETGAFTYCSYLKTVKIPSTVETIESYAFKNCQFVNIYCEVNSKPGGWSDKWCSAWTKYKWGQTTD